MRNPPHSLNHAALDLGLTVAHLLNCQPVDEVHVMRKTVIDGSAVSAFQRTALIATEGMLQTPSGAVGIQSVAVEEESAGIVEKGTDASTYRLDRLGIPLIEIATAPEVRNGAHAKEVAEALGMLLRSTGAVQRGLGTIRQDLNVSIAGGHKVEIKGAQELEDLPALVENEAHRQKTLLEIRDQVRQHSSGLVGAQIKDLTSTLAHSKAPLIAKGIASGAHVLGLRLVGFAGLLGRELMPGYRLGTELSDYAKAKAGIKGLMHSDEDLAKYGLEPEMAAALKEELGVQSGHGWVLIVDSEKRARHALEAVIERAHQCFEGVPAETRRAEGPRSVFMRPLPGSARMYPETDAPAVRLTAQHLARIAAKVPPSFSERKKQYLSLGLSEELAGVMLRKADFVLFEQLVRTHADPVLIATTLTETFRALKRQGLAVDQVSAVTLEELFTAYAQGRLVRAGLHAALEQFARAPQQKLEEIVQQLDLERRKGSALQKLVAAYPGHSELFEEIMRQHRVRVDPAELQQVLAEQEALT